MPMLNFLDFTANNGIVTLSTSVTGGISSGEVTHNGTSLVNVTAKLSEINTTLAAGGLSYEAMEGFSGSDSLALTVSDANTGLSASGSVPIQVEAAPIFAFTALDFYALADSVTTLTVDREDSSPTTSTDVDYVSSTTSYYGTAEVENNQSLGTITLNLSDDPGQDEISVTLCSPSNNGSIDPALTTATLNVLASNSTIVAPDSSYEITENQSLQGGPDQDQPGLLDGDFDLADDAMSISQINGAAFTFGVPITLTGSGAKLVVYADGSFDYTPPVGYVGTDSFSYGLEDGPTGNVSIVVDPATPVVNVPTIAQTVSEGGNLSVGAISVTDVNSSNYGDSAVVTLNAGNGNLTMSSPPPGVTVSGSGSRTLTLTGTVSALNGALAAGGNLDYQPDSGFRGNDTIGVSYVDTTDNSQSSQSLSVNVQATKSDFFAYNPPLGPTGGYYVQESAGVVTVTVIRTSDLAGAASVQCHTVNGSASSGTNFTGISDDTLSFKAYQTEARVSISLVTDAALAGGEEYFYLSLGTPSGDNTIISSMSSATIYLVENMHELLPVTDSYQTGENQPLAAGPGTDLPGILANAFDLAGDDMTLTEINGSAVTPGSSISLSPSGATVTANPDGSFVYTPSYGFIGPDQFEYTATDGSSTVTGTVAIDVGAAQSQNTHEWSRHG